MIRTKTSTVLATFLALPSLASAAVMAGTLVGSSEELLVVASEGRIRSIVVEEETIGGGGRLLDGSLVAVQYRRQEGALVAEEVLPMDGFVPRGPNPGPMLAVVGTVESSGRYDLVVRTKRAERPFVVPPPVARHRLLDAGDSAAVLYGIGAGPHRRLVAVDVIGVSRESVLATSPVSVRDVPITGEQGRVLAEELDARRAFGPWVSLIRTGEATARSSLSTPLPRTAGSVSRSIGLGMAALFGASLLHLLRPVVAVTGSRSVPGSRRAIRRPRALCARLSIGGR